jgi:2-keto-4-pentenoate hydratase/2-oxohepta-3-ene-1,7-dioic acid hydratase in catechol pathway
MKLASYRIDGVAGFGAVVGDGIVDLGRRLGHADLRGLLSADALAEVAMAIRGASPDVALADVEFLPVIPQPDKILCVGLNYRAHISEVGRAVEEHPVTFLRLAASQVGHRRPIVRPRVSRQLDYEGELAVIVGRRGRHIAPADAFAHLAGYSIYNDGSVRDWQRHTHQYTPGKNFAATGGFGPWLVTADEIADPYRLTLTTRLNGAVVQRTEVDDLLFRIEDIVAYVSTFAELLPGDVIVTGTPSGVGAARKPPLWMKPGDTVAVEISGIGTLENPIRDED